MDQTQELIEALNRLADTHSTSNICKEAVIKTAIGAVVTLSITAGLSKLKKRVDAKKEKLEAELKEMQDFLEKE